MRNEIKKNRYDYKLPYGLRILIFHFQSLFLRFFVFFHIDFFHQLNGIRRDNYHLFHIEVTCFHKILFKIYSIQTILRYYTSSIHNQIIYKNLLNPYRFIFFFPYGINFTENKSLWTEKSLRKTFLSLWNEISIRMKKIFPYGFT